MVHVHVHGWNGVTQFCYMYVPVSKHLFSMAKFQIWSKTVMQTKANKHRYTSKFKCIVDWCVTFVCAQCTSCTYTVHVYVQDVHYTMYMHFHSRCDRLIDTFFLVASLDNTSFKTEMVDRLSERKMASPSLQWILQAKCWMSFQINSKLQNYSVLVCNHHKVCGTPVNRCWTMHTYARIHCTHTYTHTHIHFTRKFVVKITFTSNKSFSKII